MPANLAVALHPEFSYSAVEVKTGDAKNGDVYISWPLIWWLPPCSNSQLMSITVGKNRPR
ncbi:MAG: hypothetical protein R2875_03500 [Desulfobacterales bacterium]